MALASCYVMKTGFYPRFHVRGGVSKNQGVPLPFPCPPFPARSSLPLEVAPLNSARGLGSAVSSPSGVWGGAPAEIEFGAF